MLQSFEHGPVRYFKLARSWAGRAILTSGIYYVDGMLLDSGPANAQVEFAAVIGRVDADQLVVTHHHEDHTGNAAFAANHLDRPPLAHMLALPLVRRPPRLPRYRRLTWGSAPAFEAEALTDSLRTRNHEFQVIHTPGHAPDHVALYEPRQRWLFAGDLYLSARQGILHEDEDVTALIASLRKLLELPDCTLFCQHSGIHASHRGSFGARLDFLLGVQEKATAMHQAGRTPAQIVRALRIESRRMRLLSGGEFSARHLVAKLLADAATGNGSG